MSRKKTIFKELNTKANILQEEKNSKNFKYTKSVRTSQSNQNSHSKLNILKQPSIIFILLLKDTNETIPEEKNYSCDTKNNHQQILLQNFMNINININSKDSNFHINNINEILDKNKCLDIVKKKLDKKKEKIKTNILNFSNPTKINIPTHFKFLIDSSAQKKNKECKNENFNNISFLKKLII